MRISTCESPGAATDLRTSRDRLRVGVAGLGRAGNFFHCRPISLSNDFCLAAVYDNRPGVAAGVAAHHGCRAAASYDDLVNDPEIDLVVVATPTHTHHDLTLHATAASKAVLVEKPFARDAAEAEAMFAAGKKAGVFVGAYHNRRYDPDVRALSEILHSGVLGPILKVSIHLHTYIRRKDWQTLRGMGGGALSNWGAHALDWCFHLFGPDISFVHGQLLQVLNPGDAEDSFHITLDARGTSIEIEYLNFVAKPLPRWHVAGQFGTAISQDQTFLVRHCDPARLSALEVDAGTASDGTYGVREELAWTEKVVPWGHWDNCPLFLESLHRHLKAGGPPPIKADEVLAELRLMERIRTAPFRRLQTGPLAAASSNGKH